LEHLEARNLKLCQDKNESCAQVVGQARHVIEKWLAPYSSPGQQHSTAISTAGMPSHVAV